MVRRPVGVVGAVHEHIHRAEGGRLLSMRYTVVVNDPGADNPRRDPSTGREIAEARERFEAAWRSGDRPRLEDHLAGAPGPVRTALLHELLTVEMIHRRRA